MSKTKRYLTFATFTLVPISTKARAARKKAIKKEMYFAARSAGWLPLKRFQTVFLEAKYQTARAATEKIKGNDRLWLTLFMGIQPWLFLLIFVLIFFVTALTTNSASASSFFFRKPIIKLRGYFKIPFGFKKIRLHSKRFLIVFNRRHKHGNVPL